MLIHSASSRNYITPHRQQAYGSAPSQAFKSLRSLQLAPLSAHIKNFLIRSPHRYKIANAAILNAWKQLMPATVHQHTIRCSLKNNMVFVSIDSPALRQELQADKEMILARLQNELQDYPIANILFV